MSWFKYALSMSIQEPGSYYTVVHPVDFYEWRFTGTIPKGTKFYGKLPRTEVIADGLIIASANLSSDNLESLNRGYKLKSDFSGPISIKVGQLSSPKEVMSKYQDIDDRISRHVDDFKTNIAIRQFVVSRTDNPHLYKVTNQTNEELELLSYGPLEDVLEKVSVVHSALAFDSSQKKGRSHEMADFIRYDNIMNFVKDSSLPVDCPKMQYLIDKANIEPVKTRRLSCRECLLETSPDYRSLQKTLDRFNSMQWVKFTLQY